MKRKDSSFHPPIRFGEESSAAAVSTLKLLLRPIVRFCIRKQIKLQSFLEVSKLLFVEIGQEHLRSESVSLSRISTMTGVHRKDVTRFISSGLKPKKITDVFTRIIGQWQTDRRFKTRTGSPRSLSLGGGEGTFADLVRSVTKELSPYTILLELERLGLVLRAGDDIRLQAREYIPMGDTEASYETVGQDLNDLLESAEQNILGVDDQPHLHLTTRFDNICPEFIPKIKSWLLKEGDKLHERARNYLSRFDKDVNDALAKRQGGAKVAFGTFGLTQYDELNNVLPPDTLSPDTLAEADESAVARSTKSSRKVSGDIR